MVNAPVQFSAWICLFNIKTAVTWLNLLSNMLEVAKMQKWKINILLQRLSLFQWISGINWYRWVDAYINILLLSRQTGNSVGFFFVMPDQLTVMARFILETDHPSYG